MPSHRVIILTWNPSKWNFPEKEKPITDTLWSCESYRKTKKGDRFIFVRVGDKDPGLISFGEVLENPTLGEKDWIEMGKMGHFVKIKFSLPFCPNSKPIITRDELYKKYHKDIRERTFSPQSSGAELDPEIAADLWTFLLSQKKTREDSSVESDENESFDKVHDNDYETETPGIVRLRRGQQIYRELQMKLWKGACAVTGITNEDLLRASHAIPWAECKSGKERLDPHNGLLLSVSLDALFDRDLICFEDDGRIRVSSSLDLNELKRVGITSDMKLRKVHSKNLPYLQAQRKRFEEKEKNYLQGVKRHR